MKNFKKLLILSAVFALVLSACKYDEGPGISLRQKRERISNGWIVTNYKIDGTNNDSFLNSFSHGDSLQLVFKIVQSGNYSFDLQYTESYQNTTKWRKYYTNNASGTIVRDYNYVLNSMFKRLGAHGKWSFANKHNDIQFGSFDLSHSDGELKPFVCNIVMLKNEMLKLKFTALDGKTHLITFEARNKR